MLSPQKPIRNEQSLGNGWAFYVLVLVLVATPLPFGSVYQWSWAGLAIVVAVLLLISTPSNLIRTRALRKDQASLHFPALLYLLVVGWAALQASHLTPDSWDHPIWAQLAEVRGENVTGTISLDPYKTWSECLKMLIFGGIFWLAVHYGQDRDRARVALWVTALAGALYALYGLMAQFTELGAYLWFRPMPTGHSGVRSTFVNRNMYANYAGFGCLTVVALLLDRLSQVSLLLGDRASHWMEFVRGRDRKVLLLILCALVMFAALFLTTSRGGIAAAIAAFVCLLVCFSRRAEVGQRSGRSLARISYGSLALVVAVYVIAGGDFGLRLAASSSLESDGRLAGYHLILQAISDSPLTGYGAGNALDVFYLYNDGRFWKSFNYAHNHYLGSAVELGLPATVVLFSAIGMVGLTCLKGIRHRRRDQIFPALGVSILVLVAVHGLVDSPLYMTANAATFSFLLGLAYAQSWPTRAVTISANAPIEPDPAAEGHQALGGAQSE